jgi:hypothetical protein
VIDPVTGLPINVAKYGDGHGGTDGSATVAGFNSAGTNSGTDWEAIKKSNTPY